MKNSPALATVLGMIDVGFKDGKPKTCCRCPFHFISFSAKPSSSYCHLVPQGCGPVPVEAKNPQCRPEEWQARAIVELGTLLATPLPTPPPAGSCLDWTW